MSGIILIVEYVEGYERKVEETVMEVVELRTKERVNEQSSFFLRYEK